MRRGSVLGRCITSSSVKTKILRRNTALHCVFLVRVRQVQLTSKSLARLVFLVACFVLQIHIYFAILAFSLARVRLCTLPFVSCSYLCILTKILRRNTAKQKRGRQPSFNFAFLHGYTRRRCGICTHAPLSFWIRLPLGNRRLLNRVKVVSTRTRYPRIRRA